MVNIMKVYTSANTSVNKTKLPSAYKHFKPVGDVLDYGAGKYTRHIKEYVNSCGCGYYPYDPYNQSENINTLALHWGVLHGYDTVYCCNVLNVINCKDIIFYICRDLMDLCNNGGRIIIQIYEGDKSGNGRKTKSDCYQRNEKTVSYRWVFDRLALYGYSFEFMIDRNYIVIKKGV